MNDLVCIEMVWGLALLKFENDHLYVACECWKQSKKGHPVLIEKSIFKPLEFLHIDLCGPFSVQNLHHKKYILVIFYDYIGFTWVFYLRLKSETASKLINFIKGIEVLTKLPIQRVHSDNGAGFTNATLKAFMFNIDIEHNFSTPYTPQQNGVG